MTPQEVLEAARAYRRPSQLHPLAVRAYDLYAAAGNRVDESVYADLSAALEPFRYAQSIDELRELADILYSLTAFIWYLNQEVGDEVSADRITDLIRSCATKVGEVFGVLGGLAQDLGDQKAEPFRAFTGTRRPKRAPAVGSAAPDGSVRLSALQPGPLLPAPLLRSKTGR